MSRVPCFSLVRLVFLLVLPFPLSPIFRVLGSWGILESGLGVFLSFPLHHILSQCGFEALLGFVDKECQYLSVLVEQCAVLHFISDFCIDSGRILIHSFDKFSLGFDSNREQGECHLFLCHLPPRVTSNRACI